MKTTETLGVSRIGVANISEEDLGEQDQLLLRRLLLMPHLKDRRKSLMATARSDIPIMRELLSHCIIHAGYLSANDREERERLLELIVTRALNSYERVVFPRDRPLYHSLLRGCVFVSALVTGFVDHMSRDEVKRLGFEDSEPRRLRIWVLSLMMPEEQRQVFRSSERNYEEIIINDLTGISC